MGGLFHSGLDAIILVSYVQEAANFDVLIDSHQSTCL